MPEPIFRSIEVDHGQHLTLGEPIPADVQKLLTPAGAGTWLMSPGTFTHASAIEIVTGAGGAVTRMDFTYASGTDYAEMLEDFENELGPPTGGEGAGNNAVWVDSATRFRLFQTAGPDGPTVGSHLVDLGAGE